MKLSTILAVYLLGTSTVSVVNAKKSQKKKGNGSKRAPAQREPIPLPQPARNANARARIGRIVDNIIFSPEFMSCLNYIYGQMYSAVPVYRNETVSPKLVELSGLRQLDALEPEQTTINNEIAKELVSSESLLFDHHLDPWESIAEICPFTTAAEICLFTTTADMCPLATTLALDQTETLVASQIQAAVSISQTANSVIVTSSSSLFQLNTETITAPDSLSQLNSLWSNDESPVSKQSNAVELEQTSINNEIAIELVSPENLLLNHRLDPWESIAENCLFINNLALDESETLVVSQFQAAASFSQTASSVFFPSYSSLSQLNPETITESKSLSQVNNEIPATYSNSTESEWTQVEVNLKYEGFDNKNCEGEPTKRGKFLTGKLHTITWEKRFRSGIIRNPSAVTVWVEVYPHHERQIDAFSFELKPGGKEKVTRDWYSVRAWIIPDA